MVFTLVHQPGAGDEEPGGREDQWLGVVRRAKPKAARTLAALSPALRRTLLGSSFALGARAPAALSALARVSDELVRHPEVVSAGIWDLGTRVAALPRLIERLNRAQPGFVFFEVQAAIPAGLVSRPERVAQWAKERLGRRLKPDEVRELRSNVIDTDFFERAESVRKDLGVAYLVGLTPSGVASESEDEADWNYFSMFRKRLVLASTYEVRTFAERAGRPFEALVGGIVVAQLLVAMHFPRLSFHDENRGCLFDYREQRETIVDAARNAGIEKECLERIDEPYRASATALVKALRAYR